MAKHCSVCNRGYPDGFAACPHCVRPRASGSESMLIVELEKQMPPPTGSESEVDLDKFRLNRLPVEVGPPSGSAVNLGQRGPATLDAPPPGSESEIDIGVPSVRVPDSNSGVVLAEGGSDSGDSSVERGSRKHGATSPAEALGLRVDSPSDVDLIAKAAAGFESVPRVAGAGPGQGVPAEASGIRLGAGSQADVHIAADSESRIGTRPPAPVPAETSGVVVRGVAEPANPADSASLVGSQRTPTPTEASGLLIRGTARGADAAADSASAIGVPAHQTNPPEVESSAVNLGGLDRRVHAPSDLNLASDALESGTSGVDVGKAAAGGDGSAEAVVELVDDAAASSAPLGNSSAANAGPEQSGLDLTMLSGGAGNSSAILPERPRRPQTAHDQSRRKAPPTYHSMGERPATHHSMGEHFGSEDDSAVDLGGGARRTAEEQEAPAREESSAPGALVGNERTEEVTETRTRRDVAEQFARSRSRSRSRALVGAVLGLAVGVGVTAGLMSAAGSKQDNLRTQPEPVPNWGQLPAADQRGQEWAARFGDRGPEDVAKMIEQLEQAKQEAEQKAADQGEALKTEKDKADKAAEETLVAAQKAAKLAEDVKAAEQKAVELAATVEKIRRAEQAARKKVEESSSSALELEKRIDAAEAARRDALAAVERAREQLEKADVERETASRQLEATTAARKRAEAVLETAAKQLRDGKYLKADADATEVARAVEQVIAAAKSADSSGKLATVQAELVAVQSKLARAQETLAHRWTPQVMLDVWLALLQQPAVEPDMATLALTDVEHVSRDPKASATLAAKAACVRGLALRQQGRKDEAKAVLTEALKNAPGDADWQAVARAAIEDKPRSVTSLPSADADAGNPLHAESAYVDGVRQFWAGAYAQAEERFLEAIRNDGRDARYHYYLGLCRWAQGKRAAARRDFERGAELERQDRPARAAVNAALERIQGNLRQEVDQFRR
jgi:hypothetical protein